MYRNYERLSGKMRSLSSRWQIWILLVAATLCGGFKQVSIRQVWLDQLDLSKVDQSAGVALANQSMWKTPLQIAHERFLRGVGTHAASIFRIRLDGKTIRFKSAVGIDDSAPEKELAQASVEFIVIADGTVIWRSGLMHAGQKAKQLDLPLKGVQSLILKVDHIGDGISGDRADWVNAYFEVAGADPRSVTRQREAEYILSPAPADKPLINAPYVFGGHPGNPMIFTVPISGARPMRVHAASLPEGLKIDSSTGIITGIPRQAGEFLIPITAVNKFGKDTRTIRCKIGDTLCLTPPMGWNSWNIFGPDISDSKIRAMADAMVANGLTGFGYGYINIDDGWQGQRSGDFNAIMPNEKFPDMKALVDYVHSKGLKIGIYSSPWVQTFAGYTGGSADTKSGKVINSSRRYGAYSFAENDVRQWASWGFDYVKYDWVTNDIAHTLELDTLLRQSGRNIVYSISNAAPFDKAGQWSRLTNVRRTTGDIRDSWCSMTTIGFMQDKWQPYAHPGSWNDPDMLIVGTIGWGKTAHKTSLTPNEQYTHLTLWAMLAAPLLIGCDLRLLDDFTKSLITNREVIAIDQDPKGIQGRRVFADNKKEQEVWSRPLEDGGLALALFNLSDTKQRMTVSWEQIGIKGTWRIRNVWKQTPEGQSHKGYSAVVPAHGTTLVKLSAL